MKKTTKFTRIQCAVFVHCFTVTHWFSGPHNTVAYDSMQPIKSDWIVCVFGLPRTIETTTNISYFVCVDRTVWSSLVEYEYSTEISPHNVIHVAYIVLQCHTNTTAIILYKNIRWLTLRMGERNSSSNSNGGHLQMYVYMMHLFSYSALQLFKALTI